MDSSSALVGNYRKQFWIISAITEVSTGDVTSRQRKIENECPLTRKESLQELSTQEEKHPRYSCRHEVRKCGAKWQEYPGQEEKEEEGRVAPGALYPRGKEKEGERKETLQELSIQEEKKRKEEREEKTGKDERDNVQEEDPDI